MPRRPAIQPGQERNAAIYARYSSSVQNDASIEQQIAECQDFARVKGYKIVATYADHAISGRTDRRPEFQKMMKAAERREFQVVLAYKSNRISRNMLHALSYEDKLAKLGIDVYYCKEEFGDNAVGRFALRTMMNVNQFYSENLAEDTRRGLMDNARQCKVNGCPPYGYRRGEDGKFTIDEERAAIVREIFRRIADGEIKAQIADDLNARNLRTGTGHEWGKNAFSAMLDNERYKGIYIYGEVRIPGGMPAIVDEDLFDRARERYDTDKGIIRSRRRRDNVEYLLTGKLFCGYCLDPMMGASGTSRSGAMYYYYRCRNNAEKHTCRKKPVRKELIERLVVSALYECITKPENVEWLTDLVMKYKNKIIADSDIGYLEEKLSEVKTAIKNIMKAIEAGVVTETTTARLKELEAEQKEILTSLLEERRKVPDITRDHILYYFEQFKNGNVRDRKYQKLLIRNFLRKVYLYDDHIKITFDYAEDSDADVEIPLDEAESDSGEVKDVLISDNMGS
ncbi:MAG: recombinase family protein [Clostridia bacterium]|nr:recombinase family protein [Clostridia bacterium]